MKTQKVDKVVKEIIKDQIKTSHHCQTAKEGNLVKYGQLKGFLYTDIPLEPVSTDVFGPFDGSEFEHEFESDKLYLYTITDRCTRMTNVRSNNRINTKTFIKFFEEEWEGEYGKPKFILCDQGSYFGAILQKIRSNEKVSLSLLFLQLIQLIKV